MTRKPREEENDISRTLRALSRQQRSCRTQWHQRWRGAAIEEGSELYGKTARHGGEHGKYTLRDSGMLRRRRQGHILILNIVLLTPV